MENVDSVNSESSPSGTEPKKDFVQYDTYSRVLSQHKKSQAEAEAAKTKLAEYEAKEREREEKRLAEEGNYKQLLEIERKARAEEEVKRKDYERKLIDGHKLNAVLEKLPGKIKRPEYYSFIDTDKIIIDPSTGEIDERSLEIVKSEFLEKHGSLLERANGIGLPYNAPAIQSGGLTYDQWLLLPDKEKIARRKEVMESWVKTKK